MSGITLEVARKILDRLLEVQIENPAGAIGTISVAGRTVTYKSADELIKSINYWSGIVTRLKAAAAGAPSHGRSVASFWPRR